MSQPTISIVGAGIGGLTLARCLLQRGVRTILYEKASSNPRHNYAITLQPSSYRPLLRALNVDENIFKSCVAVDAGIGGSGNINTEDYGYCNVESASFRANRRKLEDFLREGLDVKWEYTLQRVEQKPNDRLILEFANGQSAATGAVVDAEGPHSVIRKQFLPSEDPEILPYVAYNGKRKISRKVFDDIYASAFVRTTVLEFKQDDIVLNISVNDVTKEEVSVSWTYSRPARGGTDALHKPNRPNASAKDIPKEFFEEVDSLKGLPPPFAYIFDPTQLHQGRILHWLMRSMLVSKDHVQSVARKSIWLMGDAVHAEQIIGGGGANAAIDDSVDLAEWITQKGTENIAGWYDRRYAGWQIGQEKSRASIARIHGE
ncbi:hypothetical protein SVAN01_11065 [Stagonosporopsis vannaccii]|nr:hypothetical protein SVAN01_11065 [Stagonosporopsis vannaccii]